MKRILILALGLCLTAGCKTVTTTQPLAPGYSNQADETMGQTLASAHGFYVTVQQKIAAGAYVPSATEKQALNSFGVTLNLAQAAYVAFHNGTGTQAQAQAAVNRTTAQQASLQAQIGVK